LKSQKLEKAIFDIPHTIIITDEGGMNFMLNSIDRIDLEIISE
jgi:hypothetical protein